MSLTDKQRRHLRSLGHRLKPVVLIGDKGLTEAVVREFDQSLERHELMKIRVKVGDRDDRDRIIQAICERSGAELIQRVGNIALMYRPRARDARIPLPPG